MAQQSLSRYFGAPKKKKVVTLHDAGDSPGVQEPAVVHTPSPVVKGSLSSLGKRKRLSAGGEKVDNNDEMQTSADTSPSTSPSPKKKRKRTPKASPVKLAPSTAQGGVDSMQVAEPQTPTALAMPVVDAERKRRIREQFMRSGGTAKHEKKRSVRHTHTSISWFVTQTICRPNLRRLQS